MKVITITEESHGLIGLAMNTYATVDFLIEQDWISRSTEFWDEKEQKWKSLDEFIKESPYTSMREFLYHKIEKNDNFFDGSFYFGEEYIYE